MNEFKIIHTPAAPAALGPYSQAVVAGEWVFASGQIPIDPGTGELIDGGAKSVGLDNAIHQSDAQRLLRADHSSRKQHFHGRLARHGSRQRHHGS